MFARSAVKLIRGQASLLKVCKRHVNQHIGVVGVPFAKGQVYIVIYIHINGNASKPHIMIFGKKNIFLIPLFIKCQWLVSKFKCKVNQNGKNRSSKHSVASLF